MNAPTGPDEPSVLAVRYTADPVAWHGILSAMGAAGPGDEGVWAPYRLASGTVVVHRVEPADPRCGSTLLCLAVLDPAGYTGSLGSEIRELLSDVDTGAGRLARITGGDGVHLDILDILARHPWEKSDHLRCKRSGTATGVRRWP